MLGFFIKIMISGLIIASVVQFGPKSPRIGALILSLPLVSISALLFIWFQNKNLSLITKLSLETMILVPLGLAFFVPLAFAEKIGLGFWPAFILGIVFSSIITGLWLWSSAR